MTRMSNQTAIFALSLMLPFFVLTNAGHADERNPIGEKADYTVDRNKQRTSSFIKSGTFNALVDSEIADDAGRKFYHTNIDYRFVVQFFGSQTGREAIDVDQEYFTESFLEQIRRDGQFESSRFKVKHMGFADAQNLDGNSYLNCDKLLFYDIEGHNKTNIFALFSEVLHTQLGKARPQGNIENLKILAHVKFGVPVLGAVKLDMEGDYQGTHVKAGADFQAP